jgi:hypothetical protein
MSSYYKGQKVTVVRRVKPGDPFGHDPKKDLVVIEFPDGGTAAVFRSQVEEKDDPKPRFDSVNPPLSELPQREADAQRKSNRSKW